MSPSPRLIEDFIPIKEISAESAREKSIRKGHISTLHLWWARRPLVASRAAVFAALVNAPSSPSQRTELKNLMIDLCRWEAGEATIEKARKAILEAHRERLELPENTPLKDVPPPKVLDMFAGGGAIPLEALRLGCETHAIDLNPVAHIIELCTLVYPQKYGKKLAEEVEKWGNWVIEKVRDEIGALYPEIDIGEGLSDKSEQLELLETNKPKQLTLGESLTPVAYLWTRTVRCPNPACGATVPLVRQTWLCKKSKKYVALKVVPNHHTKEVEFEVVESTTEQGLGFDPTAGSSRGNSTCRHCGTTVGVNYVKSEGKQGRIEHRLMSIVCTRSEAQGKIYLSSTNYQKYIPNEVEIIEKLESLCKETGLTIPDEPLPDYGVLGFRVQPYGLSKWSDLFTSRQLLSLMTFVKWVREAHGEMIKQGYDIEFAKAISSYLGILCDRLADRGSTICRWDNLRDLASNTFSRQALPMVWDFAENNPLGNASGNVSNALDWIINFIKRESNYSIHAKSHRFSATTLSIAPNSLDAIITDPPYFDSVPYADLSDFFYVWLKRSIGHLHPEHFSGKLTPKKQEAIMEPSRHGGDKAVAAKAYQDMMHQAFLEANRVLKENGIMTVVYAHKTTAGWATLIDSLRRAGFVITEAWPLDTEMAARLRGQNSAALASSIFLVARKRTTSQTGDYASDVRSQLRSIVQERVKTLMIEGVSGADLVIACVGAGLRAYTQYETVELPNGEELDASSFLDEVQKEVAETILKEVMGCDQKGVSSVDKSTQYYILGRYEYGDASVEFDEANTLARGVGVELDGAGGLTDGRNSLVKKTKNLVQIRDYQERGAIEDLGIADGHPVPLIDILHRLLWLSEKKPQEVGNYLVQSQPDATQLRLVAQALSGRSLTPESGQTTNGNRTPEQQAIATLLASWKRSIEDNLFTRKT